MSIARKDPGYWKDWYWNKGGRERIQAKRKKHGFIGFKKVKWYNDKKE